MRWESCRYPQSNFNGLVLAHIKKKKKFWDQFFIWPLFFCYSDTYKYCVQLIIYQNSISAKPGVFITFLERFACFSMGAQPLYNLLLLIYNFPAALTIKWFGIVFWILPQPSFSCPML